MSILLAALSLAIAVTAPADLTNPPAAAERLPDGLITMKLSDGTGSAHPAADDVLKLRYTMWRPDGKVLDQVGGDQAAVIQVSRMLPGWREAVMMMTTGETRRSWIPASLGDGRIPKDSSVVIDTEFVSIVPVPKTPADVAAPPSDAQRSKSGLASKVITPGTGDRHPSRRSTVLVNYTGWTTDGRLFDSTIIHEHPAEFPLSGVIAGWTEGIPLMTVGETRRFWIPAKLAYGDDASKPQGMLVFDVELLSIR
jgi:FKBP-type peptidyl-prolyl cis-trans isomerase